METPVKAGATAEPNANKDRARVLVVDDDERNLLAIKTVIEDIADVVIARSGEEALRHLLKGDFSVILLDVYMPGMDGYETAQLVRSREQTKRIPIVFLSAVNKETEHLMRGYSMGAVDYVFKPVEPVILRSKVAVFVDLYMARQEVQRKAQQEQMLLDESLRLNAERLRAEQELRLAEQRQGAIIQSLPIVFYLEGIDDSSRVPRFVSGNFSAVTGFDFSVLQESPDLWAERLHPDDRERALAALTSRRSGSGLSVEYRWLCADGHYKHFLDQAVLLRDKENRPVEYAGTLLDITERKDLESQLAHARKMDAIGQLTGGIAHDFNNLLAAVLGGLNLVERRVPLARDQQRIIDMTRHAAEQGADLVRRLLVFARRQTLEPRPIDIGRLWISTDDLLAHTLGGLVQLEWQGADDVAPIFADEGQLQLAIMNLIINARDAMPDGGLVTVAASDEQLGEGNEMQLPAGDYVKVRVSDTGGGIAPEHLDKVMEPFYSTKELGKGTGLGLSMVYGFIKQSGGTVRIESELGTGTDVDLWLPAADGSMSPVERKEVDMSTAPTRSLSILLVDDTESVRATTAALLEDLGHQIAQARTAPAALAILDEGQTDFDLILTDYAMPRMSGGELIGRAREKLPDIAAIIVTGYADATQIATHVSNVPVLTKPFTVPQLKQALDAVARELEARENVEPAATGG
ncbi:MAG: response regulator [Sphingobium sp.]|nr:response regulator [Sphingobium sp.]